MFEEEITYFNSMKEELIKNLHEGKFALIKGRELAGTYSSFEQAYEAGVNNFGKQKFFIKQILKEDLPENIPALTHGVIDAHL